MLTLFKQTFCRMGTKLIVVLLLSVCYSVTGFSQVIKTINLDEISQRKVRQYIASRSIDKMQDFSLIHPSFKKDNSESDYKFVERTFYLKYKLQDVWNCYRHINLAKLWEKHSVRFGLMISKHSNSVTYKDDSAIPEIDTGQVYFFDIRVLKGLFNIPAAFEIINIDPVKQKVEFSYIDGNKSLGKQTIQFFDTGEGRTRIVHRSYFKSESAFRDDLLYPYFHTRFIKEFHRSIRQLISRAPISETIIN
jgi:hypothetical protein